MDNTLSADWKTESEAFNKMKTLFYSSMDLVIRKRWMKCYVLSVNTSNSAFENTLKRCKNVLGSKKLKFKNDVKREVYKRAEKEEEQLVTTVANRTCQSTLFNDDDKSKL